MVHLYAVKSVYELLLSRAEVARKQASLSLSLSLSLSVCVCVCVCVSARAQKQVCRERYVKRREAQDIRGARYKRARYKRARYKRTHLRSDIRGRTYLEELVAG